MNNLLRIFYHELTDILHDKGILIFIVFVPLAYPLLYSWVYTNEVVRDVPAVVVDQCSSATSRELVRKIDGTPDVKIVRRALSMEEARKSLENHEAYGIYLIPSKFDMDLFRGEQTHVGLYCDMSSMLYYKALLLAATDVSMDMNRQIKVERHIAATTIRDEEVARMPIEYDHVRLYNPSGGFASFLIPPVLMLILQQTLLLGIGMQMGRTRERWGGRSVPDLPYYRGLSNEVNPSTLGGRLGGGLYYRSTFNILTGKALPYLGLYLIMGVYAYCVVTPLFGLPRLGSYGAYLVFLVPFLLACIAFAICLSLLIYRREDCILIFVFLSVPFLFLSGISWPASAMPQFWKWVSFLIPSTFGMNGYVRIVTMGCPLSECGREILALSAQAAGYFSVAFFMYKRILSRR